MESNKEGYYIADYSVSQTTLDQVILEPSVNLYFLKKTNFN